MDLRLIKQASAIVDLIEAYHKHTVIGMDRIPKKGPVLLAVNHSLATYDISLLMNKIYKETGRITRSLSDRWFFKFEPVAKFMEAMGSVEGKPETARKLLEAGELICVAPGGMRESIRPSTEKYQIIWGKRKGFVKLAIETQTPIVLAACPKADDIFDIYPTKLSHWFYNNLKLPFAILRGIGPTPIPKPVQLTHMISEPLYPPKIADGKAPTQKQINDFHRKVVKEMRALMGEALTYRPNELPE